MTDDVLNAEAAAHPRATGSGVANDDERLAVNCGRCGKAFVVAIADLARTRLIDCESCRGTLAAKLGGPAKTAEP
jgi:ribosomal protein S27E